MIIGLISYIGAGKDTVANYLVKKGFEHRSLSDEIRYELKNRNMPESRDNLINVGNEMRQKFGNDYWAKKAFQRAKKSKKNIVLSSIRNPAEVKYLKKQKDCIVAKIICPAKIRYQRLKKRDRIGEYKNFQDFVAGEKREQSNDSSKQQIHKVILMTKIEIDNSGSLENLYKSIDKFLKENKN